MPIPMHLLFTFNLKNNTHDSISGNRIIGVGICEGHAGQG